MDAEGRQQISVTWTSRADRTLDWAAERLAGSMRAIEVEFPTIEAWKLRGSRLLVTRGDPEAEQRLRAIIGQKRNPNLFGDDDPALGDPYVMFDAIPDPDGLYWLPVNVRSLKDGQKNGISFRSPRLPDGQLRTELLLGLSEIWPTEWASIETFAPMDEWQSNIGLKTRLLPRFGQVTWLSPVAGRLSPSADLPVEVTEVADGQLVSLTIPAEDVDQETMLALLAATELPSGGSVLDAIDASWAAVGKPAKAREFEIDFDDLYRQATSPG